MEIFFLKGHSDRTCDRTENVHEALQKKLHWIQENVLHCGNNKTLE